MLRKLGNKLPTSNNSALTTSKTIGGKNIGKDKMWCNYCNKPHHMREMCWKLNGKS